MQRNSILKAAFERDVWDLIVIGGGAIGLGTALDAASRGYQTLLLEQGDFAQGTSSRSTKLIHGGLRYLQQGRISFVRTALQERALLLKNASHLVHELPFVVPISNHWEFLYYFSGIKIYNFLAEGKLISGVKIFSHKDMENCFPASVAEHFQRGIVYFDAQFDDARLAINLAQTIVEQGGFPLNYMQVNKFLKDKGKIIGLVAKDIESGTNYEFHAKGVVNATGTFVDEVSKLDQPTMPASLIISQGTHIVLDRSFFPGQEALIVPKTADKRLLFIIPWYHRVLIGTTETPMTQASLRPKPQDAESRYLLDNVARYLAKPATLSDVCSCFAGIRALKKPIGSYLNSSLLPRDCQINISSSQLVTAVGGKWTTYRKIGQEVTDQAAIVANLPYRPSRTKQLAIHGCSDQNIQEHKWPYYGVDAPLVEQLAEGQPQLLARLHPDLPCRGVDILWSVRHEMARTVDDVLSRRSRSLFLGAAESMQIAPQVAALMANELGYSQEWQLEQVKNFQQIAKDYLP